MNKTAKVDPLTLQALAKLQNNPCAKYCPLSPFPKQQQFLALTEKEILYGGAAGGAKTISLLMAALQWVHTPGYAALLFRKAFTDHKLSGGLITRSHEWWDKSDAHWDEQQKVWTFPSGAKIQFGYLDSTSDKYRYQGAEVQFLGFDELTQIDPDSYLYLHSRLRRPRSLKAPLRIRSACNPGGAYNDYYYNRFIANPARNTYFLQSLSKENPYLNYEEYAESLASLDPITKAQLLEGQWVTDGSGKVYGSFSSANIIQCLPVLPPESWHFALGIDIGWHDATALVIIAYSDHDPALYVVHAEAHTHNTISQTAERIRELDRIYSFESMVIDQAGSVLTAIEDIKARFSLPLIPAKKNDKLGHIRLLNSDFASSTIYLLAGTTEPLQKELASHQWKDSMHRKEHDASPNHCCDALLYVWRTIKRGEATAPPPTTHDPLQEAKEAFQRILNKNREEREISRDIGLYL